MNRADPGSAAPTGIPPVTAGASPVSAVSLPPPADLLEMYRRMLLIRHFEERASELYRAGEIPGFLHLSIGQEASAVGACWPLGPADVITSTHRGHGHCIAKGMAVGPMLAELMGKATGTNRGMGGSMHISDPRLGVLGANGIVAAGLPIATGAAAAIRLRQGSEVAVGFFGDGAVAQGAFHEAVNLAALWRLPVLFFCENNGYAEFSRTADQQPVPLSQRMAGYGLRYEQVDGNDVLAVADAAAAACAALRKGDGPRVIEAMTFRQMGHYEGDPQRYRGADEAGSGPDRDPIARHEALLAESAVTPATLAEIRTEVGRSLDAAVEEARRAPEADWAMASTLVLPGRGGSLPGPAEPPPAPRAGGAQDTFRMMDAIHDALAAELRSDERVFIAGVDVGPGGNVFGLTRGLHAQWPGRVLDTPISETAIMGLGVGAAMSGLRPVVELMYLDFIGVCLDQILNQAAKLHFMTGGAAPLGLTIRTQFGAGRSSGSQHSQSLEALLAHIPGLIIVMPRTPADAYGLLRAAIQDPAPVVFIENRLLYGSKGPRPAEDYRLPLGRAQIIRPGTDVTLVSWSRMCNEALAAAEEAATGGISVEVIDLRTIVPLDRATILASVRRTNRLVIVQEAVTDFGVGAEIAATVADQGIWALDAPVVRVGARTSPAPYSPAAERGWLPDREQIGEAIRAVARA